MKISGWGRYPVIKAQTEEFDCMDTLRAILRKDGDRIVHANGKSYGDSALNPNVILPHRFNHMLDFNTDTGVVACEAGVSLQEIIEIFLPRGWFLDVTPGTKLITVGGAIAADVHGKNHHKSGCFSNSVISLDLMSADGTITTCSQMENCDLFRATCGGMGLTGVILRAWIQLKKVKSAVIKQRIIPVANLNEIVTAFVSHASWPYSVAWIDCLSTGRNFGRSILMVGDFSDHCGFTISKKNKHNVPFEMPGGVLNRYSIAAFNHFYYRHALRYQGESLTSPNSFFYPLDSIGNWNRIYGRRGFIQYQFVIPLEIAQKGLERILKKIVSFKNGSFLSVLKLLGSENANFLSFPMNGFTLAVDFKITSDLFAFLNTLDKVVLDYGGRLYLAKDARMNSLVLQKGYPRLDDFRQIKFKYDPRGKFRSLQSKRLGV